MSELVEIGKVNFRFECQPGCINCCTQSGHVYLTEEDIDRISAYLNLDRAVFEQRYVYRTKNRVRLTIPRTHWCHFLTPTGCTIHAVKPIQCRTFPYWPEHVSNRSSWKDLREYCPGIGVGPLVEIRTVRETAQSYRDAYPDR
jgi:Fe-S-cluster containining protein